jgi:hypothetical protein
MALSREFVAHVSPSDNAPVITNWPTQLLGNRPVSGEVSYVIGGKTVKHAVKAFTPARNLKTGESTKAEVKKFRKAYSAGIPASAEKREGLNFLTYLILSAITGKLPTPKLASGESTLKAALALHMLEGGSITIKAVNVHGESDAEAIPYTGVNVMGTLGLFKENHGRIVGWPRRENTRGGGDDMVDWEEDEI